MCHRRDHGSRYPERRRAWYSSSMILMPPNPEAPKMTWVHWLLYNIPPSTHALEENISTAQLPPGTREGVNDWNRAGYGGPCPPIGRHRYFFKLYALDCVLDDLHSPTKPTLEAVMQGHIIEQTELVGMFKK